MLTPIANEILEDLEDFIIKNRNSYIAADVQGFIRRFNRDGSLNLNRDKKIIKRMKNFVRKCGERLILKTSGEEINYFTEGANFFENMQALSSYTKGIIITTLGSKGSFIKIRNKKIIHIPAFKPNRILDETGAGDCYLAVFLSEFINSDHSWDAIKRSGYYASVACSFLLEKRGPYGFRSKFDIINRLNKNNIIETNIIR